MKRVLTYIIATLVLSACGDKSNNNTEATSNDQVELTKQQEEAVKAKYLKLGGEIATATQAELLKVVQGAMAEGGPVYAVDYCNVEALDIKDSLSVLNNCTIQRLSSKYRNPEDKPVTEVEMAQLASYEKAHSSGEELNPAVYIVDDEVEYFQPIMIGLGACLVCHGDPETQIPKEVMSIVDKLYPNDLATGYAMNDFRGVWKITFLH